MPGGISVPAAGSACEGATVKNELAMAASEAPAADVMAEKAEAAPAVAPGAALVSAAAAACSAVELPLGTLVSASGASMGSI